MWHLLSCVISSYCIQSQRIYAEEFIQGNCICPNTIHTQNLHILMEYGSERLLMNIITLVSS